MAIQPAISARRLPLSCLRSGPRWRGHTALPTHRRRRWCSAQGQISTGQPPNDETHTSSGDRLCANLPAFLRRFPPQASTNSFHVIIYGLFHILTSAVKPAVRWRKSAAVYGSNTPNPLKSFMAEVGGSGGGSMVKSLKSFMAEVAEVTLPLRGRGCATGALASRPGGLGHFA
jgi:hypothetical protein